MYWVRNSAHAYDLESAEKLQYLALNVTTFCFCLFVCFFIGLYGPVSRTPRGHPNQ